MSSTRKITWIALLSAISTILAFPIFQFPLLPPPADFLKVDLTILPILVGTFVLGLSSGLAILLIRSILWLFLFNQGPATYIGLPMNMVVIALFMFVLWAILKDKFSVARYIVASIVATLSITVAMVILNLVYAIPLYVKFAPGYQQIFYDPSAKFYIGVTRYISVMVLPFNLLEGLIFAVAFAILYGALRGSKAVKFINSK